MRMVCQRALDAEVKVNRQSVGRIDRGLLVYLGVGSTDNQYQQWADYYLTRQQIIVQLW